jgi:exodeoxyribonuclease III
MRFVTWNVNSLKMRLARVEAWIADNQPDIVVMQETKLTDAAFPHMSFAALGYESVHHGDGRWNGVAIVSRLGVADARAGFSTPSPAAANECRIISANCGGTRVYSLYVPNGRQVGSEFYAAKLAWLADLRRELYENCDPQEDIVLGGDFNVAPEDADVWDITQFAGATHVTPEERAGLRGVIDFGLVDVVRAQHPGETGPFSWWDYRAGAFHKGEGMRIDLVLASRSLSSRVKGAYIDREARKKGQLAEAPSDHAPVVVDIGQ